jgi:hypothetical protein
MGDYVAVTGTRAGQPPPQGGNVGYPNPSRLSATTKQEILAGGAKRI